MIARFLQNIVVNDIEKNMEMNIDKGEELFAIDRVTHYELRKADGWSATSNTARTTCGNVKNAVSATNVRDLVGNVWKWLDEFIHDPTGSAWNWYDVMSGQKVGQLYMANNTGLHALIGGGYWYDGVLDGSRTVHCGAYPWYVNTIVGVWCVCDSL